MVIKIDLEKAYDRLNYTLDRETLQDIGLPNSFLDLVWTCIITPSMCMLQNRDVLKEFCPSRVIKQGDPFPHYLSILCTERLSHIINLLVDHKLWMPFRISRGRPYLSHLAFANDLILISKVSLNRVDNIQNFLKIFGNNSRQAVRQEKTNIFFSNNIPFNVN